MMNTMKFAQKYGNWAIVTGASAGIGEEFATQLASQKKNLLLTNDHPNKLNIFYHIKYYESR